MAKGKTYYVRGYTNTGSEIIYYNESEITIQTLGEKDSDMPSIVLDLGTWTPSGGHTTTNSSSFWWTTFYKFCYTYRNFVKDETYELICREIYGGEFATYNLPRPYFKNYVEGPDNLPLDVIYLEKDINGKDALIYSNDFILLSLKSLSTGNIYYVVYRISEDLKSLNESTANHTSNYLDNYFK